MVAVDGLMVDMIIKRPWVSKLIYQLEIIIL